MEIETEFVCSSLVQVWSSRGLRLV